MKKDFKKHNFPICFLNINTGIYTAYTENGVTIKLNPKKGHIIKSLYNQKFQTQESYLKEISYIFNHKINGKVINQEITQYRFDEIIDKTINYIFTSDENRNFLPTLEEVKKAHVFNFGNTDLKEV